MHLRRPRAGAAALSRSTAHFDPKNMSANVNLIAILKAKPFDGLAVHEDAIHTA